MYEQRGFVRVRKNDYKRAKRQRRGFLGGFTLIELLVVISIIALLMSILMPALARVRKQAKAAICQSNLKQWGTMASMYTGDNDGNFFQNLGWWSALRPYYTSLEKILMCPMATKPVNRGIYGGAVFEAWVKGGYPGSYGMNSCIPNVPRDSSSYWRRDDVKGAADVPLILDAQWVAGYPWWTNEPPEYEGARWSPGTGISGKGGLMGVFCIPRHGEVINGLFLDYTVRTVGLKELWLLKWCRNYDVGRARENEPNWSNGTGWMERFKDYDFMREETN